MLGPVRDEGVNLELGRRAEHLSLSHSSATHGVFAQVSHLRPALGGSRAFLGVLAPREPLQTLEPNRLREIGRKIERARTASARTSRGERGGRDHLSRLCVVIVFALRAFEPVRGHGGSMAAPTNGAPNDNLSEFDDRVSVDNLLRRGIFQLGFLR